MKFNIFRIINIQILQKRFCSNNQVRVRFAPSPTGLLHVGSLRTALYNYLFARANNGAFILRIEDTDQQRCIPGSAKKIEDDLLWCGIIPDEDPVRGGPVGPYLQSKRLDIYREYVVKLLNNKSAYHCFCTEERLNLLRTKAAKTGQVPTYDNKCRHLDDDELENKLQNEEPYCIRFKLTPGELSFDDMIYGKIGQDISKREGDPVIMKTDGYPTYHFANVVDDHLMQISHVFRGIEWQISTPKHIMMYNAFGWNPPIYGHLPLLLNANGTKLSKRQNDIQIDSFKKEGIFPLALLNYVIHAGGGFNKKSQMWYIDSYEEMIKQFDISNVRLASSKLSPEKLLEFNKLEMAKLLSNEKDTKLLIERLKQLVREKFSEGEINGTLYLDDNHVLKVLKWAQPRIFKLTDLVDVNLNFLWILPPVSVNDIERQSLDTCKMISDQLLKIDTENFNQSWINSYLKEVAQEQKISYPKLMKDLRRILSGLKDGPPIAEMITILGKDDTLVRLNRYIS